MVKNSNFPRKYGFFLNVDFAGAVGAAASGVATKTRKSLIFFNERGNFVLTGGGLYTTLLSSGFFFRRLPWQK
jgi:hypothetical protein